MKKISTILLLLWGFYQVFAQQIPRSSPEAEGVSSTAIQKFIGSYQKDKHELHSVMIIRHGKVIAEKWATPYAPTITHSMYSVSKSWTSTAIGFAVDEKRFTVEDKVLSFFPEYADLGANPFVKDLKIKDLLTMSVGHEKEPMRSVVVMQPDWVRGFLNAPIAYQPGTKFLYNTLATYMLSAIIQTVTGQTFLDYLQTRLLKPLSIQGIDWEKDPRGINTGGWGIRVHTEDMAKLGLLYLNKGKYEGKQILSENWVHEATMKHIDQNPSASQAKKDSSDWLQGYGYQFWRCRNGAFRADGAYGQYIVMLPAQDAVVVITSESLDLQDDLNMIWEHLLPAFQKEKLKANPKAVQALQKQSIALSPIVSDTKKGDETWFGKTYTLSKNPFDFAQLQLERTGKQITLHIQTKDQKTYRFGLSQEAWNMGETDLLGPYLLRSARVDLAQLGPFKTAASYYWQDAKHLGITLRYLQSPHHWEMILSQEEGKLNLKIINSYEPKTEINVTGM